MKINPPTGDCPYPTLALIADESKPFEIATYLESRGVAYGLGAKDPSLTDLDDFTQIDCSGFRDVVLYHMARLDWGVGQYNSQYVEPWIDAGLKESTPDDVTGSPHLYLFMLPAEASSDGIGHTGFVSSSVTAESYGHHGPGSRCWGPTDGQGNPNPAWDWQKLCRLWLLSW
jgi:hypothetical protein